jgi:hypothetical protein
MNIDEYKQQFVRIKQQEAKTTPRFLFEPNLALAMLTEDKPEDWDRQYFYHTAWAARILAKTKPAMHYDFASALPFVALASVHCPITHVDIRIIPIDMPNVTFAAGDLMKLQYADGSLPSVSCMHVMEHVGLGRYGDTLDYDGDLKGIAELKRVTAPGGDLLFVVPMGAAARIQFNAHRIYEHNAIVDLFGDQFDLIEMALIPEKDADGGLVVNPSAELMASQKYACGCYWWRKKV